MALGGLETYNLLFVRVTDFWLVDGKLLPMGLGKKGPNFLYWNGFRELGRWHPLRENRNFLQNLRVPDNYGLITTFVTILYNNQP